MSNILITGATGNIGSQVIQQLQESGTAFTAGLTKEPEQPLGYPYVLTDFGDKASLVDAFQGVDTLFAVYPIVDPLMTFAENVLDAAQEAGVGHIVHSSAATASPQSDYPLLKAHGEIDEAIMQSGIPYTITRPSSFMQNYVNFLAYNIQQGEVYSSTGSGQSAWIDVRDIAAANAAILQNPGDHVNRTYTLTGSESFPMAEGLKRIGDAIGKSITYIEVPQEAAGETMKQFGTSEMVVKMIGSMEMATKDGALAKTTTDTADILGQAPISFNQFVADHRGAWEGSNGAGWS